MSLRAWRPALRLARRDLWRHKLRAALTFLLVALPVLAAAVIAVSVHNGRGSPEAYAVEQMGDADALVRVSPYARIRADSAAYGFGSRFNGRTPRRDPDDVDLRALLPAGSTVEPGPTYGPLDLVTGGSAFARVVPDSELTAPMTRALTGRLPRGSDEVAVGHGAAKALGLLDRSGEPRSDATLGLVDGTELAVVGTIPADGEFLTVVGRPGLTTAPQPEVDDEGPSFLVTLPDLDRADQIALMRRLAEQGVALQARDALLNPEEWGLGAQGLNADAAYAGALAVLVGLVEVVLVVGAAFAVAARRQLRDLGLVACNGGAGKDVRRVMVAQGVVLGVPAAVVGAVLGTAAALVGGRWAERRFDLVLAGSSVPWPELVGLTVLGALTAVVASLVPAWSLGRVSPVQALSGRFPVRLRASRPHPGSFWSAGAGLVALGVGGYLTSRWFAPRASESPLGPFISAIGLLLLLAGVVWATPYLVQVAATTGRRLPLSGRYAFRAAGRHRFRTAAATTALTFTVAVAVLTGFAVSEAAADAESRATGVHAVSIDGAASTASRAGVRATVEDTLGHVTLATSSMLGRGDRSGDYLAVRGNGGWPEVRQTDRASLEAVHGPLTAEEAAAFDRGEVLVWPDSGIGARRDEVRLGLSGDRKQTWTLPVTHLGEPRLRGETGLGAAFVTEAVADRLGLAPEYAMYVALADRAITDGDLQKLRAYGLNAWSEDPYLTQMDRFRFVGVAGAGVLSLLVVGIAVALAAAEGKDEAATLTAVGAGPGRRRAIGAMHGLFIGLTGTVLGVLVGLPSALAFVQMNGDRWVDVPWLSFLGTLAAVALLSPVAGWAVTPTRLRLTRRVG